MHTPLKAILLTLSSALLLTSCTNLNTASSSPSLTELTSGYLSHPNFSEQLTHVTALETRVMALSAEEPLAMGALGSALIEINPASLTGHYALVQFYQHVDASEAAQWHEQSFQNIRDQILASGDGSAARPYQSLSKADAELLVRGQNRSLVGGIYQNSEPAPLQLLLLSRSTSTSPVTSDYFDLSNLIPAVGGQDIGPASAGNPWDILRILADNDDSAARAAIGTYLAKQRRYESAIGWLQMASQDDNLLAHTLLARIFWYQSGLADRELNSDQASTTLKTAEELTQMAIDHHVKAIGLGSTESMYTLGRLLLEDSNMPVIDKGSAPRVSPQTKKDRAVNLLGQAGALGHAESLLYLASQYQRGTLLPANEDRANRLFAEAANLRNPKAVISYARYIAASPEREPETQLRPLLQELADAGNPEAMVVLGNLYAKGVGVQRSSRKAVRWYKKAVARVQASHHGDTAVINEVAWTLAVSDQKGLLKPSYAQAIMDTMMQTNKQVQNHPEYLDTWAATYAANGNFVKAIELQKRALRHARIQERTDVIAILQTHLESFEAGAHITDRTP
jgi:TPR repeat protein